MALGCTPNEPYRTADPINCTAADCVGTFIEQHDGYDLAYVEFTERGNVFSRKRKQAVLDYISEQARYDPSHPEREVIIVVFVHGWKHNARATDENVGSFREATAQRIPARQEQFAQGDRGLRGLARTVDRRRAAQ